MSDPPSDQPPKSESEAEEKPQGEQKGSGPIESSGSVENKKDEDAPVNETGAAEAGAGGEGGESRRSKTVTEERKKDLLMKARSDRRKWIHTVPLPYRYTVRDPNNVWTQEDRLAQFQSSIACERIPSATKILSELYGLENHSKSPGEIADRIESIIGPLSLNDNENQNRIIKTEQQERIHSKKSESSGDELLSAYRDFWTTLLRPDCALLVQNMRNFQRSLANSPNITMESASKAIKSYVDSTFESLKVHPSWSGRVDDMVRRSLESFLYGQFQPIFNRLEWNGLFSISEKEWADRIAQLQFVGPSHLEIGCLDVDDDSVLEALLAEPIRAISSIDQYFSPREKLQQILKLYKVINESLASALNNAREGGERKLPSADDVLPTMILAVLRARPEQMFRNLQMIEIFCPPNDLRGEAGYAYTNLYGAVQFLNDLDTNNPESLSISPEDFRKGIESCKQDAERRMTAAAESTDETSPKIPTIRINDVRTARLHGEKVNLQWALRKHGEQGLSDSIGDDLNADFDLPQNFSRSYNFLGLRPEDIKLSDLPLLLEEYGNLIKITERLVGERASRLSQERRQKEAEKKHEEDEKLMQW